eukprot:gnl/TRDRNA2_/TRDRNA2_178550_c0_seq1.p3 gnl/TRDRNA2_/TRDRNA2_178550_c0~~gnl/TRDRNA2_/TRDRNA2_178550_c0_seq1.p3  ORF type:complete len:149 (+),score=50.20 gnl/TRDRNA2_/TRDRNA2_178550_c0_seq1:115-561(+)
MSRVLVLALLCGLCAAIQESRQATDDNFWPFTSWSTEPEAAPKKPVALRAAPVKVKNLEATKQALLSSEVFIKKTEALCDKVNDSQLKRCQELAGERLFCTMFTRHEEKFKGMEGEAAEREKCRSTDIMTTVAEATKDAEDEEAAKQD